MIVDSINDNNNNNIGVVIAILGTEQDNGRFLVDDTCFTGIPKLLTPPISLDNDKSV